MAQTPQIETVRPDAKGRITLGNRRTSGISGYRVEEKADGVLILTPQVEIPAREAWLWKNETALAAVRRGLTESAEGHVRTSNEDFTKDLTEDE